MSGEHTCGTCKSRFLHFRPKPVTVFTVLLYVPLVAALLWIFYTNPPAPSEKVQSQIGINLTETWHRLAEISQQYHPFNAHANDKVRDYLVDEIKGIIKRNGAGGLRADFVDDTDNNVLYTEARVKNSKLSVYMESLNIIVEVHGKEDLQGKVLVNSHFDAVSTSPGVSDAGIGVVTQLALIDYYTQEGHTPTRGLVFLINNGEEGYLNGAAAFVHNDVAKRIRTFLNLEGAGAGTKAVMFRASDAEVAKFYRGAKHPLASSFTADGFKQGLVRSETDYKIFDGQMGWRGMDVAFFHPRAVYHTQHDNLAYSNIESLWNMIETALGTTKLMVEDKSNEFERGKQGHNGVWFDFFGNIFGDFTLSSIFALTMCLLTITPFVFGFVMFLLFRAGKLYIFTSEVDSAGNNISMGGWKGFFRLPVAFILATFGTATVGAAINKINPMIVYSSTEAVYACLFSVWFMLAWTWLNLMAKVRPSATQKFWALLWSCLGWWLVMIIAAIGQDRYKVATGYVFLAYYICAFVSLIITTCGFAKLPIDDQVLDEIDAQNIENDDDAGHPRRPGSVDHHEHEDGDEASERTPLFRRQPRRFGRQSHSRGSVTTQDSIFCSRGKECAKRPYHGEQIWGKYLPKYNWVLEMLFGIPLPIMFSLPVGLIGITSIAQTGADGNAMASAYALVVIFVVLLLVPLAPYLHRITYHIPVLLLCVFIGTFVYNLIAFPFSLESPLKVYFLQRVNMTTGTNTVYLGGIKQYVKPIAHQMPSSFDRNVDCVPSPFSVGLHVCTWEGLMPRPISKNKENDNLSTWFTANVTRNGKHDNVVHFDIKPRNSRNCKIILDDHVRATEIVVNALHRNDTNVHHTNPYVGESGTQELRLWSREWERGWSVDLTLKRIDEGRTDQNEKNKSVDSSEGNGHGKNKHDDDDDEGMKWTGHVLCMWSDANEGARAVPALAEVKAYFPRWAIVTKYADGLVEGWQRFAV